MSATAPTRTMGAMRRMWALVYRHLCLYRHSWPRVLELMYWPTLQMCIWGFTSTFLMQSAVAGGPPGGAMGGAFGGPAGGALGTAAAALLGGVLLWEVSLRSQMGVSVAFLEEIWSRNLGHVFVSPLRPWELVVALLAVSVGRMVVGILPAVVLAWLLYAFNILALGPMLVLLFVNLLVMGWWVALAVVSLILRHGAGAEALAWSVLFGLTPFSAVFYPVSVLPPALRPVALALPSSHVFEGMRALLAGASAGSAPVLAHLAWATGLNLAWMAAAVAVFAVQFRRARETGAMISLGE